MNTGGEWQERLADHFRENYGLLTYPLGFGVVGILSFIFPFWTRMPYIKMVDERLRAIRLLNPDAKISVIAHSFGTYIITKLLLEQSNFKLDRLVLCGSIVPLQFSWIEVLNQLGQHRIINDVGTKDLWPVIARVVTFGYGPSGRLGFKYPGVADRFHNYKHSDYFEDVHVRKYWEPFLLSGRITPSPHSSEREPVPYWIRFLVWIPFRYPIWMGIIGGIGYKLLSLLMLFVVSFLPAFVWCRP
jgi:pimeloyl-ACP methyl ester carboxylesterase